MNTQYEHSIEKGGTGIEKGGTGIEKGGTGIEKGGTGIEKGGTGIRALRTLGLMAFGMLFSTVALAAPSGAWKDWGDLGGTVQFGIQNKSTLTASWSTFDAQGNPIMLIGTGRLSGGEVSMPLYKLATGFQIPGEPMPTLVKWGRVDLTFNSCGGAAGRVSILKVEHTGTGDKVEHTGTGDKVEHTGTGDKVEHTGTGDKVEHTGTGDKVEHTGTGDKYQYIGDTVLLSAAGSC